ncbi:MAG: YcjX family protein, partial [Paracoccaceae bacterium]
LPPETNSKKGSLWHEMQRRYTAYKRHIVRPFFRNHFARIDRQIVLIDVLEALHRGPSAIEDLRNTMRDILIAFRPGRNSPLGRLIRGIRVERILFAATKADHLHHNQHVQLTAIMQELTDDAARQAQFRGAQTKAVSLASLRSTTEETRDYQGRQIDCVRGIDLETRQQTAFFAGELPINPKDLLSPARQGAQQWLNADYSAMRFAPPPHALRQGQGIAHIRLDKAAQFLFGDRL